MSTTRKKRALVIEGGGMRSAYVSGAVLALYEIGPRDFDVIIGTSAGACCAVNFIAEVPEFNKYVLEKNLASDRFIRFSNFFRRNKSIVDVDYLIDECHLPLARAQTIVQEKNIQFLITATNCHTGETYYFDGAKDNLREALRASCAMPYLYRRKLFKDTARLMDGGLSTSIPIQKALDLGCEELYVVCSRPLGYRKKPSRWGWINHLGFPSYPRLARALWQRHIHYNHELELMESPPPGIKLVAIRPQHKLPVSRVTRNPLKIRQGIEQGFYDAYQVLKQKDFLAQSLEVLG